MKTTIQGELKENAPASIVKHGNLSVRIYEVRAKTNASGVGYKFQLSGQKAITRASLEKAEREAKRALQLLSRGGADIANVTASDLAELETLRRIASQHGMPTVSAMQEWCEARSLVGNALITVAKLHNAANVEGQYERITQAEGWRRFIAAKDKRGNKGTRTYGAKSKTIMGGLSGDLLLDTLTSEQISKWADTIENPATRNELLKRLGTMLRWAQRNNYFPRSRAIPTDNVERWIVPAKEPGIVTPDQLKRCLEFIRCRHPEYLAALAICSLGGMRCDEAHGKRADKGQSRSEMPRQMWQHIHVKPQEADGACGWFSVTVAKKGTPSNRKVPIQPVLAAWLNLCPRDPNEPYICRAGAMDRVRDLLRHADVDLGFSKIETKIDGKSVWVNDVPENAFRHTFISARLPIVGIVQTASEAGNSPGECERSYRVPLDRSEAEPYWTIMPNV